MVKGDDEDVDDIYIMMQCLFVCHKKIITSKLSAGGAKQDVRQALPAVSRLWPSGDDDDGDDDA